MGHERRATGPIPRFLQVDGDGTRRILLHAVDHPAAV